MAFDVRIDRHLVTEAAGCVRYALVTVTAPQAPPRTGREPLRVALVLDRSGSMDGEKMTLAREAVRQALQALCPEDRFSLVVYDEEITTVVESTLASPEARRSALARLRRVDARGSTDLHGGWHAGCEGLAAHLGDDQVGRCLLLTDGLANVGITERETLVPLVRQALAERRVATSTFGVGADFDERLLRDMADAGGGRFYFIERPAQIPDLLTSELGELIAVVARDAAVTVQVPAGVEAMPLGAFTAARTDDGIRVAIGDLVSGQELTLVVAFRFPAGRMGETVAVRFGLTDRDGVLAAPEQVVGWSIASDAANEAQDRDVAVDRAVAALHAARARAEALELNRRGDYGPARVCLEEAARLIRGNAGDDAEMRVLGEELEQDGAVHEARMAPMDMKRRHFASYSVMNSRTTEGKARR